MQMSERLDFPVDLEDDEMCFACGRRNPNGLHLSFSFDGAEVRTSISFPKTFQGYRGVVHGGLLSTVLDEAMVTLLNKMGHLAVTAELTVRFLRPARVDERIDVTAELLEQRGRTARLSAVASDSDGTEIARATSRCFLLGPLPTPQAQTENSPEDLT
jgi:uncharacterized protein (TIGR00369 family)